MELRVLIPKESHLLDQLIRSILWRCRWLLRRGCLLWRFPTPRVCNISHVILVCSCSCYEPARPWSWVKTRVSRIRWRVYHQPWFVPHCLLRVKPWVDGLPVVLEVSEHCPPSRGAHHTGGWGARVALRGGTLPPLFVPVGLGGGGRDGCGIAPGCGWRGPGPWALHWWDSRSGMALLGWRRGSTPCPRVSLRVASLSWPWRWLVEAPRLRLVPDQGCLGQSVRVRSTRSRALPSWRDLWAGYGWGEEGIPRSECPGVASSLSLSAPIGLVGAVTGIGLVWPLPKWDWRDVAPSRGREGYRVSLKSGERVGVVLRDGAFSVPWIPGSRGIVGVVIGVRRWSIAPWVCCLCTPYVPCRGAWVLKPGCWGATFVELPGATSVKLPGIVVGRELLPTRVVLVGGGSPNCDRSPVKGTGGGSCANGCQVRAYCRSSSLEAGDDIVGWKWSGAPVGSRDSSSSVGVAGRVRTEMTVTDDVVDDSIEVVVVVSAVVSTIIVVRVGVIGLRGAAASFVVSVFSVPAGFVFSGRTFACWSFKRSLFLQLFLLSWSHIEECIGKWWMRRWWRWWQWGWLIGPPGSSTSFATSICDVSQLGDEYKEEESVDKDEKDVVVVESFVGLGAFPGLRWERYEKLWANCYARTRG